MCVYVCVCVRVVLLQQQQQHFYENAFPSVTYRRRSCNAPKSAGNRRACRATFLKLHPKMFHSLKRLARRAVDFESGSSEW